MLHKTSKTRSCAALMANTICGLPCNFKIRLSNIHCDLLTLTFDLLTSKIYCCVRLTHLLTKSEVHVTPVSYILLLLPGTRHDDLNMIFTFDFLTICSFSVCTTSLGQHYHHLLGRRHYPVIGCKWRILCMGFWAAWGLVSDDCDRLI